jgi:hypothetical protein
MFVGHYGPSFLAKSVDRKIPLFVLFLAVQWVDVLWAIFVLLGIERVRIVPGYTASNSLDLYFMPYTHSLLAALLWSALAAFVYRLVSGRLRAGFLVGGAVFSHWVLDLLVHRRDLALYDNTLKVGFGLWDYPLISLPLEILVLVGGFLVFYRGERAIGVFVLLLALLQIQQTLTHPVPVSPRAAAWTALAAYALLTAIAFVLERRFKRGA